MDFPNLFKQAVDAGASDIHLRVGRTAALRVNGELVAVGEKPITADEFGQQLQRMVPAHVRDADMAREAMSGIDFSFTDPVAGRFRCSAFRTLGRYGMTMRTIKSKVPSLDALHLPSTVMDIALSQRGLTLVTGTTGSGKSTTLAAMIDLINTNYDVKIITVEDPIEFLHEDKRALITQIEVGSDSISFDQALRQALRQDPDVILIGELRDVETLRMALRAADTGHQVFATVHASRAAQTIERIVAMFPPAEHKVLLSQLAHSLEAIISQRLVVTREDKSRRPAVEILRGGPVTEKYIIEGKLTELTEFMEGGQSGMQSFDQHLLQMYTERIISGTEALKHANRPEALATAMRGIKYVGRPNGSPRAVGAVGVCVMSETSSSSSSSPSPSQIVTVERRDNALIATVNAKMLDDKELKQLGQVLDQATGDSQITSVIVNLARVQLVPSLGLGLLLRISQKCTSRNQQFTLAGLAPGVRQTFIVTKLDRILKLADTVEAALQS